MRVFNYMKATLLLVAAVLVAGFAFAAEKSWQEVWSGSQTDPDFNNRFNVEIEKSAFDFSKLQTGDQIKVTYTNAGSAEARAEAPRRSIRLNGNIKLYVDEVNDNNLIAGTKDELRGDDVFAYTIDETSLAKLQAANKIIINARNLTVTKVEIYADKEEEVPPVVDDVLPIDIQFGADYNNESIGSYSKTWTATKDGKTWTIVNFNNNNNKWNSIKCGSKNGESTASITSPAINAVVKNYVISLANASNVNSAKLTIMNGEEKVGEDIDITENFVAGDVNVPVEGQKGYSYILTINNAQGTANGSVEITKVTLYGEGQYVVKTIANTAETAYTVAEAVQLIDAGEALTDIVFVKGIVSKVDEFNEQYKNITYWISDDGTEESQQFECYRGKNIEGADFTSIDDVEVGAQVIVTGKLKKYGETYEFDQNNALVEYTAPVKPLFADGIYFIYNKGTEKFLAAGADWGTHAVVNETGLDYTIAFADGKYTLDSQVSNGGDKHFVNGEYNDGLPFGWTIEEVAEGLFTISDGTKFLTAGEDGKVTLAEDATADAAKWQFTLAADRLAEQLATFDNATEENGVDATFFIKGPDFNRNDLRNKAWVATKSGGNQTIGGTGNGGDNAITGCESWNNTFDVNQTLSNLPDGIYEFSIAGYGTNGTTKIYANETEAAFVNTEGAANFVAALAAIQNGEYTGNTTGKVSVVGGMLKIGVKRTEQVGADWTVFDNARLTYYGPVASDEYKTLYQEALAAAQTALANEDYAAVTGEEKTALEKAIADYTTVEDNKEAYEAAIAALNAATNAFTAAKADYEALEDAKLELSMLSYQYATAAKKAAAENAAGADATSAADAKAKSETLYVAYRQYAESSALLEGVEGATNMTEKIVNPNAEEAIAEPWAVVLGEGSGGSLDVKSSESLTDGEGNANYKYFDGGNWGASAWDVSLQQTINLPKGKYQLTVSGRAAAETALTLFANDVTNGIAAIGNTGGLFGRGWSDASVEFELAEDGDVLIGVQGVTTSQYQWMSFTRFRLMQFPKATGIETVKSEKMNGQYFDLQGRMVTKPAKGLYINNGKKVLVK